MDPHSTIFLSKCAQFLKQRELIDVWVTVGVRVFPAHRIVLAANSDHFYRRFSRETEGEREREIGLEDEDGNVSAAAFEIVMDFMYSGKIHVNDENVDEVLKAANFLQVKSAVEQCCNYLETKLAVEKDVQFYCHVITLADQLQLMDLKEAMESRMALMYREICEKEEFLTDMNADVLSALLRRDDLSAPSEDSVFKLVMQWIEYRKEERMGVAAQVIGAVRLARVASLLVEELETDEMEDVRRTLRYNQEPSSSPAFALEEGKPRSMRSVLAAIAPKKIPRGFDFQDKKWGLLGSFTLEADECYCVEVIGDDVYVALSNESRHCICCYKIGHDFSWSKIKELPCDQIDSLCHFKNHLYVIHKSSAPYRYDIAKGGWQYFTKSEAVCKLSQATFCKKAAAVYKSCVYVLCGQREVQRVEDKLSVLYCFDPEYVRWQKKASTKTPHFGSSLLVVNNNLYVAGGKCSFSASNFEPCGDSAVIEVYNDREDAWSVVQQTRIPQNDLGAVEIDGRVYFIINSFPVDSGIRIPAGQANQVSLEGWGDLKNVKTGAVLFYFPRKR